MFCSKEALNHMEAATEYTMLSRVAGPLWWLIPVLDATKGIGSSIHLCKTLISYCLTHWPSAWIYCWPTVCKELLSLITGEREDI